MIVVIYPVIRYGISAIMCSFSDAPSFVLKDHNMSFTKIIVTQRVYIIATIVPVILKKGIIPGDPCFGFRSRFTMSETETTSTKMSVIDSIVIAITSLNQIRS